MSWLAFIPAPPSNAIHLGPLQLRAYGLMIAIGVIASVWLAGRRFEERGIGTREDMSGIAMWAVPGGVIGARIYHVMTDWKSFRGDWIRVFKIWEGGLGIWGGIFLGTLVGIWAARRRGISTRGALIAAAPALPLAQAIGRLGNWWNQELFGRPTTLPWGLKVDAEFRPSEYADFATFHPTFLYEGLWNLGLCAVLVWLDRRRNVAAGKLFAIYVAGYTFARFFIERMRVDSAYQLLGLRINEWVSGFGFLLALAYLLLHRSDQWVEGEGRLPGFAGGMAAADDAVIPGDSDLVSDIDMDDASEGEPGGSNGVDTDLEAAAESDLPAGTDDADADAELGPAAAIEDDLGLAEAEASDLGLNKGDPLLD